MKPKQIAPLLIILAITAYMSFEGGIYYSWLNRPRVLRAFFGSAAEVPEHEIVAKYEAEMGVRVEATYGSAGTLLTSMMVAKVGDIYAPGSPDYMSSANKNNVTYADTVKILAYMVPAIIVQKGNPKNITSLEDLAKTGVRVAIGDTKSVAVGVYALELLNDSNLWTAVKPNIVTYASSASQLQSLVAIGSVDAIIGWHVLYYWNTNVSDIVWINPEKIPKISYIRRRSVNTPRTATLLSNF
jgi:molybdate transport system substrate-binding protein